MKTVTKSAKETAALAKAFAKSLKGGEVIGLVGDLGAGKTTFIQGLCKELGVKERVTSPTFVYFHVHQVKSQKSKAKSAVKTLVHADAYRADAATLRGIGLDEYFGEPGAVVLIEWADRVRTLLPKGAHIIRFSHLGKDKRAITLKG